MLGSGKKRKQDPQNGQVKDPALSLHKVRAAPGHHETKLPCAGSGAWSQGVWVVCSMWD